MAGFFFFSKEWSLISIPNLYVYMNWSRWNYVCMQDSSRSQPCLLFCLIRHFASKSRSFKIWKLKKRNNNNKIKNKEINYFSGLIRKTSLWILKNQSTEIWPFLSPYFVFSYFFIINFHFSCWLYLLHGFKTSYSFKSAKAILIFQNANIFSTGAKNVRGRTPNKWQVSEYPQIL